MTKKETIQVLQSIEDRAVDFPCMTACDWVAIAAAKRHLENSLELKEVDIEKEARHYLLYEHVSPLNEIFHQADLNAEMVYHREIENAFKAGAEVGLKVQKGDKA